MAAADARVSARKRPAPSRRGKAPLFAAAAASAGYRASRNQKQKGPIRADTGWGLFLPFRLRGAGRCNALAQRSGFSAKKFVHGTLPGRRAAAEPRKGCGFPVPFWEASLPFPCVRPAQEHSKRRKTTQLQRGETAQGRAIPRRPSPHGTAPARRNPAQASRGTRRSLCLPCRPGPVLAIPAGGENPRGRLSGCGCR